MCGFLGEYSFGSQLSDKNTFRDLLALSKHRGPDDTHIVKKDYYQLGFNRLALLDLSEAGQQPKQSPSARYHLVFNGEVYNYKELAEKYKLTNLRSTSDTEVILHLFDHLGIIETLKELNGMFAIAVIDNETSKLYLSRDFAGIKPLFYGSNSSGIVFASQFDQIFKHPWFKDNLTLRKDITKEYFAFGYMQSPNTLYKNIYQVNPGECLVFQGDHFEKKIDILKFAHLFSGSDNDYKGLNQKLSHAVNLQLNADRSLASFLSGGVDSPLVTSLAKEQKASIEAFTMEVDDPDINEAEYAKKYAQHLKIEHQIQKISANDLLNEVDNHFESFPEPFGDFSSLPTYLVTKKAVQYHTAMLSGDGGDELFFGYPRMYDILRKKNWFKMPPFVRKNLVRITNKLGFTNTYAPFAGSLQDFYINKQTKIPTNVLNKAFSNTNFSQELINMYSIDKKYTREQLQHFSRWNEFYAHMQRVLVKVDRTSMKNSLEVRVPLLDKHVIENAWNNIHDISKLKNLKKPLKEMVYQYIPKSLMMQNKKGFGVPMEDWLRNELRQDLETKVFEVDFYGFDHFESQALIDYVQKFLDKKHNNAWGVWHIYAWQKWACNQNFI